ncbi:unnamed protein product [Gordionus sp. m RMFG-2023]
MRYTKLVSVWPVGLVGGLLVEKPLVNPETRTITGFNSLWGLTRTFKLDMAAFAINAKQVYENPAIAIFDIMSQVGYMENDFLIKLGITLNDLEPKAELSEDLEIGMTWILKVCIYKLLMNTVRQQCCVDLSSDYQIRNLYYYSISV